MDSIPYSEFRERLAATLERVEASDEAFYISRRGRPAGVLMSVAQFRRLKGEAEGPAARLSAWRARHAAGLAEDAASQTWTDPFADVRNRNATRPVTWAEDIADPER